MTLSDKDLLRLIAGTTVSRHEIRSRSEVDEPYFDSIIRSSHSPPQFEHTPTPECQIKGVHWMKDCPLATSLGYNK